MAVSRGTLWLVSVKNRTFAEKCLLVVVIVLALSILGLTIALVTSKVKDIKSKSPVCETEECKSLGSTISESLDETVDPCSDFYSFVCGGWEKKTTLPPDRNQYGFIETLQEHVLFKLHGILSEDYSSGVTNIAVENTLKFYNSCMDEDRIESQGNKPILKLLENIGGWPIIDKHWNESNYNIMDALAKIHKETGIGYIIFVMVGSDFQDTSKSILQLSATPLSISTDVLLNQDSEFSRKELHYYKDFFFNVVELLGAKSNEVEPVIEDIIMVETEMAKLMVRDKSPDANVLKRMSIKSLMQQIPQFDWLEYLQLITNDSLLQLGDLSAIKEDDVVVVNGFNYLQNIVTLLAKLDKTSRVVANYLGWRVLMSKFQSLPEAFNQALAKYSNDTGFAQKKPSRWKSCTIATESSFDSELSFLYLAKYFPEDTKTEIMKLALDLKFQLEVTLKNNSWMDSSTKKHAVRKIQAMMINIGAPDWIFDAFELEEYYRETNKPTMTDDFFSNECSVKRYLTTEAILSLREKRKRRRWTVTPITVNAGYSLNNNAITFPAAFLQEPLYSVKAPRFYNYAAVGSIIGHEMTHGFDNEGRLRNSDGSVQNWWSKAAEKEFEYRAKCFMEQYDEYGVNGKATLAENIADNGGLHQAYKAFIRWKTELEANHLGLPKLERFTLDQQFFISYGSIWCTKYSPAALNFTVAHSNHSPSPYRLIGTVSNMEEFYEAFKCPKKNRNICKIW